MSEEHDNSFPCVHFMLSRRAFLKGATVSAAMVPLLSACEFEEVFDTDIVDAVEFDINEKEHKALQTVGKISCIKAGAIGLILIRVDDDNVYAFDQKCPHASLSMGPCDGGSKDDTPSGAWGIWDNTTKQLTCTWHGSVFGEDGQLVQGPAVNGITRYAVEFDVMTGKGKVQVKS